MNLITLNKDTCIECDNGIYKIKGYKFTNNGLITLKECNNDKCRHKLESLNLIKGVDINAIKNTERGLSSM